MPPPPPIDVQQRQAAFPARDERRKFLRAATREIGEMRKCEKEKKRKCEKKEKEKRN
jgi:hypothetical protein